jgi:Uma2 family endonuclease
MTVSAKTPRPGHLLDGVPPDTRVVIADVTWDVYERFVDAVAEGENLRVAFDGRDIEVMTLGPLHETFKARMDAFIAIVTGELGIMRQSLGSTTWKRKKIKRGVESDLCYYFDSEKLHAHAVAAGKGSNDVKDYPNPDLAIEIDLSPSKIDRPGIYAALQVPELWRLRNGAASIEQFIAPGAYVAAKRSRFLPIRPEDLARWIFGEDSREQETWEQRLREWVRTELARDTAVGRPS